MKYIHMANLLTCGNKAGKAYWLEHVRQGKATTLETFWKARDVAKILDAAPDVKIFLDSGAHSLLNAQSGLINSGDTVQTEKKTGDITYTPDEFYERLNTNEQIFMAGKNKGMVQEMVDYSFVDGADVKKYIEDYIAFIHKYKNQLMGYVNLDIIYNAEKSWEIQEYMESQGLRPIPVFHYGEDMKWLRKYCEEYDYIGIGGMATGLGKADFVTFAKACFSVIDEIKPDIKVHGFAVTSYNMMSRWSWFSVDSTSWVKHAAYGNVICPRFDKQSEGFDFNTTPFTITVSEMALIKPSTNNVHYMQEYSTLEIDRIHQWFDMVGVELDEYTVEGKTYPCLSDLLKRQRVNVYYYSKILEQGTICTDENMKSNVPFF